MIEVPLPPVPTDDLAEVVALLAWPGETYRRDTRTTLAVLEDGHAAVLAGADPDLLGAAVSLWAALVAATATPEQAAALPAAPYAGPGGGTWHVAAATHLPARVVLAGAVAVREVLAGGPAAAPGLPGVPDVPLAATWVVEDGVDSLLARWAVATTSSRRQAVRTLEALGPRVSARALVADWAGHGAADEWRADVGWQPFVAPGLDDDDHRRFMAISSGPSYTARYPSTPVSGSSRMVGRGTRRGRRVMLLRARWLGSFEGVLDTWVGRLAHDLTGLPGALEDRHTLAVPLQRLTDRPWRTVELRIRSGLGLGGLRGGRGLLPSPRGPLPGDDMATRHETELADDSIRVGVDLPSRDLPPLEDAVAGLVRLFAHRLLSDVPGLTPHATEVLARWREHGPDAVTSTPATLAADVDAAVRETRDHGVELGP